MKRYFLSLIFTMLLALPAASFADANTVRIKDIADFEGVRTNTLIGYGLVVGLAGDGDSSTSVPFTRQTLVNVLEKMGVNTKEQENSLRMKNVAPVMVTAELPAFARQGGRIDVNVASLGPIQTGWINPELEARIKVNTPLGRVGQPADVADVIVFLASEQARWLTGQTLFVGGGHKM